MPTSFTPSTAVRPPAQFAAVEQEVDAAITDTLQQAGIARPRPLAQLLLASAYGIGSKSATPAEIGPAIRLLVERLVRPELPSSE